MENAKFNPRRKNYHLPDFGFVENCLPNTFNYFPNTFNYFPDYITKKIEGIPENFIWKHSCPRIKHKTLRMNYKNGRLKNVDNFFKIATLQCSWVKKL